jgi:uncharacterized protein
MFLSIKELEEREIRFAVDFAPGQIEFDENEIRQLTTLRAVGAAELLNEALGEIRVHGHVVVELETYCDRCLDPIPLLVDSDFDLSFRQVPEAVDCHHHEVELDESESEMGFYEGAGMELGEVIREHILLSMPMRQICKESCLGICPHCGQNRNEGACRCEVRLRDERWAALAKLRSALDGGTD